MMLGMVTRMIYTPTENTWHQINHYLPVIGLKSYSYKPHESLELCDRIVSSLETFEEMQRNDLYLVGMYKTTGRYRRSCSTKDPRKPPEKMVETETDTLIETDMVMSLKADVDLHSIFGSEMESSETDLDSDMYQTDSDEGDTQWDDVYMSPLAHDSVFTTTPLIE